MLKGLKRALDEEDIHQKMGESHRVYRNLDERYGQSDEWDMRTLVKRETRDL